MLSCINNQVAGRTQKEYYKDNKDKIFNDIKQYRENNKEMLDIKQKLIEKIIKKK